MKIDGVFSGGGVKAYAFLGAFERIASHNYFFERVAGTSAGAIMAALLASNYNSREMNEKIKALDVENLLDPPRWTTIIPFSKWLNLYFRLGINKGNKLENWIRQLLANKNVYTFSDLKPNSLKVVVSDITLGRLVVMPDDLQRIYGIDPAHFSVAKAVRMSAGFPYFFMPKKMRGKKNKKSLMIDGGMLSNFPLWLFRNKTKEAKRPVLGVKLGGYPEEEAANDITNALDMFHALFSTMINAHDARYLSKTDEKDILFIPVNQVGTTEFNLSEVSKNKLIEYGRERADDFLTYWPY